MHLIDNMWDTDSKWAIRIVGGIQGRVTDYENNIVHIHLKPNTNVPLGYRNDPDWRSTGGSVSVSQESLVFV